jgi:hypothetical protein
MKDAIENIVSKKAKRKTDKQIKNQLMQSAQRKSQKDKDIGNLKNEIKVLRYQNELLLKTKDLNDFVKKNGKPGTAESAIRNKKKKEGFKNEKD